MPGWKTLGTGATTALAVTGAGTLLTFFGSRKIDSILQQKLHSIITSIFTSTLTSPTIQLDLSAPNGSIPLDLEFFLPEINRTITASLKIIIPQAIHLPLKIDSVSISLLSLTNASLKSALNTSDNVSNTVAMLAMLVLLLLLALVVNCILDKFIMLGGTKILHTEIKKLGHEQRSLNCA